MLYQDNRKRIYRRHKHPKHQQGMVIIVALFIMALIAVMSYAMMMRLERDTYRTMLILRNIQAEFYAQGSIDYAIDQLRNNWEKQKPKQVIDQMPIQLPAQTMNGYTVTSIIDDMQARFNLNNLTEKESQEGFKRLVFVMNPKFTEKNIIQLTQATVDWISKRSQQSNVYNDYYLKQTIPYRAAHRPMMSISELRLVKGMTEELYQALQDEVTTLPEPTPINVQSASPEVLVTLAKTMNIETAKALTQMRISNPFVSVEDFLGLDIIKNHPVPMDKITTQSRYFLLKTTVSIEKQNLVLYTLLERIPKGKSASVIPLWQSKGSW